METIIDTSQLRGIVKERNEYRTLFEECLCAFNSLPNRRFNGKINPSHMNTYKLASKIEDTFGRFK